MSERQPGQGDRAAVGSAALLLGAVVAGAGLTVMGRRLLPAAPDDSPKPTAAASPPSSSPDISKLADAGVDQLRSVAKWMIGAFAAIASLMLAGIQLTSLGKATGGRLALAVFAIVVAVGATMLAIYQLTKVLQPVIVGPDDATRRADETEDVFGRFVAAHRSALLPSSLPTGASLWSAYEDARAKVKALESSGGEDKALEAAKATLRQRNNQLARLVWFATFVDVDDEFKTARRRVFIAAVFVAAAIALFAWAANPPDEEKADKSEVAVNSQPVAVRVLLNDTGRQHFESLLGTRCSAAATTAPGAYAIAVAATDSSTTVVLVPSVECGKPVRFTVAITDGSVTAVEPVTPATPAPTK